MTQGAEPVKERPDDHRSQGSRVSFTRSPPTSPPTETGSRNGVRFTGFLDCEPEAPHRDLSLLSRDDHTVALHSQDPIVKRDQLLIGLNETSTRYLQHRYDQCEDQESLSYQEWITQRRFSRRPPGLPRPPRRELDQPLPSAPLPDCDDEHLDDEWESWYSRNVANGTFSDWRGVESPAAASPSASSQDGAASNSGGACLRDDDLDEECDEWFARNVASGKFASWLEEERAVLAARDVPTEGQGAAAAACAVSCLLHEAPQAVFAQESTQEGTAAVKHGVDSGQRLSVELPEPPSAKPCGEADRELGHSGVRPCKQLCGVRGGSLVVSDCGYVPGLGGFEDEASAPNSPVGSDCRAGCDDSSRDSSRSCSALSLQSWGESQGSSSSEGEGDEEEVLVPAGVDWEGECLRGLCLGHADFCPPSSPAALGDTCAASSSSTCADSSFGRLSGVAGLAPLVLSSRNCSLWEDESALAGGLGCCSADVSIASVVGAAVGDWFVDGRLAVGMGLPCGAQLYGALDALEAAVAESGDVCPLWLEPYLDSMLNVVVSDALFLPEHC